MYFLHHTSELGFSFKNRGTVMTASGNSDVLANKLKQISEITETVDAADMSPLLPVDSHASRGVTLWDDKPAGAEMINLESRSVSLEYLSFYNFRLVTGEMLTEADPDSLVLINESAVKAFGWHEPVGKHFDNYTVKGVIKDIYNCAPTVQTKPFYYYNNHHIQGATSIKMPDGRILLKITAVLFKYKEGMWKSCKKKIEQMKDKYSFRDVYNTEEEYNYFLKSENALIKLLSFVSAICLLICVFGFVSLASLTCEERRKAIAIRKINGATVGNILAIFAKEYFLLLIIGAAIAFSAGYFIMHGWLENYVKQTSIPAWIYFSILFVLALLIVLCVGWQVYKTSIENPAEVVKME